MAGRHDGAPIPVAIQVATDTPLEIEEATLQLRAELLDLELDVTSQSSSGTTPAGSKAAGASLGTLLVTIARPELLIALVTAVRNWMAARRHGSVRLEIGGDVLELTGVSSAEQRRLADAWLHRHRLT
jgi:hypothetical protein